MARNDWLAEDEKYQQAVAEIQRQHQKPSAPPLPGTDEFKGGKIMPITPTATGDITGTLGPVTPAEASRYRGVFDDYGGGGGGGAAAAAPNYSTARNGVGTLQGFNPEADEAYMRAMAALDQARSELPSYNGQYNQQLSDIYAEITGRDPFRYDLDADMLYQQYKDKYITQGRNAMMDTMGQAAALTGGYGSTYSQSAGQQAYDAYLQNLNDVVPELYDRAYGRWQDEGNELLQRYSLMRDMANDEYNRYRDEMSDYWTGVQYADTAADRAYQRASDQWNREYQLNRDAYSRQQDEQNRVLSLAQIGYQPTAEDIAAAGMSEAEAMAYYNYLKPQPVATGGGGGSSPSRSILREALSEARTEEEAADFIANAALDAGLSIDEYNRIMSDWQKQAKRV